MSATEEKEESENLTLNLNTELTSCFKLGSYREYPTLDEEILIKRHERGKTMAAVDYDKYDNKSLRFFCTDDEMKQDLLKMNEERERESLFTFRLNSILGSTNDPQTIVNNMNFAQLFKNGMFM